MKRILYILALISFMSHAQYVQLGNKLLVSDNIGQSSQGRSISLSSDGKTAIVGGNNDNSDIGAAWIYTFNGVNFSQLGNKLVGSDYVGASQQGWSVSISADGKRAVVGGIHDNGLGAAWVYTFNGTSFVQAGNKLVGSGATSNGGQGTSVDISDDGNTIVVGGAYNDGGVGAIWIYTFNGSNFVQVGGKLSGSDNVGNSNQGISVSITPDGKKVLVGGRWDNTNIGAAWIYTFNGTNFIQAGNKLVGSGNVGESWQGSTVYLSSDGKVAMVGGPYDNSNLGATWVFTFNGSNYVQIGTKLLGTGAINTSGVYQGFSISLTDDNKTALIGGHVDNNGQGAVWVYTFNGSNFEQSGNKLVVSDAIGAPYFGNSLSLSADGKTAIIGGAGDNSNVGAAWIFINTTTSCNVDLQNGLVAYYPFNGNANDETGIGNNGIVMGASLTSDRFGINSSAYSFNGTSDNIYIGTTVGNFGLSDFTISLWMKAQANQIDYSALFSKEYWSSTTNFLNFELAQSTGGYLSGDINQDTDPSFYRAIKGNTPILDNVWHNCILIRKNGKIMFYTDGLLSYSDITTGTGIVNLDNTNKATFGARTSFGSLVHFYNGAMDDIKIYNRALNDCEIIGLYNEIASTPTCSGIDLQSGLIAYYPFSGNANDASGNSNNGTVVGAILTADRLGVSNNAYDFSGGTYSNPKYIEFSGDQSKKVSGDKLSISLWLKITGDGVDWSRLFIGGRFDSQYGIYKPDSSDDRIVFRPVIQGQDMFYGQVYSKNNLIRNVWHHITAIYDGSKTLIYVNGQLNNSTLGVSGLLSTNSGTSLTGGETLAHTGYIGGAAFDGNVDDIYIYNRVLSDCEISLLYGGYSVTVLCTTITNVSISGPSIISNCSATGFAVVSNVGGFYNWSTPSGSISNHTSANISVSWVNPGVYPLSVTVFNGCSTTTSIINVTVSSNVTVTSISKPIIGRNEDNLIVNNTIIGINYKWLLNSSFEPGQNSYIHTSALKNGIYQVSASSVTPCDVVLSDPRNVLPIIEVVTITNYEIKCITVIDDLQKSSIEVYPNPGSGLFNLKTENMSIGKIEVFNLQGKVIYSKAFDKTLDLRSQSSGIYLLKIYDNTGTLLIKSSKLFID